MAVVVEPLRHCEAFVEIFEDTQYFVEGGVALRILVEELRVVNLTRFVDCNVDVNICLSVFQLYDPARLVATSFGSFEIVAVRGLTDNLKTIIQKELMAQPFTVDQPGQVKINRSFNSKSTYNTAIR